MNTLHRYILRELLFATVTSVALFGFLLVSFRALRELAAFVAAGALPLHTAAQMVLELSPYAVTYAMPFGLLTAVLLTLGRISALQEITAMRTAGIGLMSIAAPVILVAITGVGISLVVNFSYGPRAVRTYRESLHKLAQKNPLSLFVERTFIREFGGVVLYVGEVDGDTMRDVWIWRSDKQDRVTEFAWAREGAVHWNEDRNSITVSLRGVHGHPRNPNSPEDFSGLQGFPFMEKWQVELPLSLAFKRSDFRVKIGWMNLPQLLAERNRLAGDPDPAARARRLEVDMNIHEKAAMGYSVLSLAIVAVPLAIRTGRKETSANLGLALLLTLVFYLGVMSAWWVKNLPHLHPEMWFWVPNVGFQAIGLFLWWRLGRN